MFLMELGSVSGAVYANTVETRRQDSIQHGSITIPLVVHAIHCNFVLFVKKAMRMEN
jgi:hypothetical protein